MEKLQAEFLDSLINETQTGPLVTIYMPMHVTGSPPHLTENQLRFKNMIHAAITELENRGDGADISKRLKAHLDKTLSDLSFFEYQTEGLLLCASGASIKMYHLPMDTEEYVAVDDQYHLAPLIGLIHGAQDYYVLTVTQHEPVLFRGDLYGLSESGVSLPTSLRDALNIDESNPKADQSQSAGGSSIHTAGFNSRGGAKNTQEEDRMRYFRMIDAVVMQKADRKLPLILAGIESEVAEYKQLTKYPKIVPSFIHGSYAAAKHSDLSEQAAEIIEREVVSPKRLEAIDHFERVRGETPEKTVAGTDGLESAADQGRVDTLLLRTTRKTHDTVRDTIDSVTRITFPEKQLSKSLNRLALKVASMSGTVLNLDDAQMPGNASFAATLRY